MESFEIVRAEKILGSTSRADGCTKQNEAEHVPASLPKYCQSGAL